MESGIIAKGAPVKSSKNENKKCSTLPNVKPDSSFRSGFGPQVHVRPTC